MTAARDLINDLASLRITLWKDGGDVRVSAPRGSVTPEIVQQITRLKPELLVILDSKQNEGSTRPASSNTGVTKGIESGGSAKSNFSGRLDSSDQSGRIPATLQQERLWFLEELNGGGSSYNIPIALHLTGSVDRAAISNALYDLQQRHEVLRTRLIYDAEGLHQVVDGELQVKPSVVELHDWTGDTDSLPEEVRLRISSDSRAPFDRSSGALWRATFFHPRDSDRSAVMLFVFHHLVADAWSLSVLREDFIELFRKHIGEKSVEQLPNLRYRDYAAMQRSTDCDRTIEHQLEFWKGYLRGSPPALDLPIDKPRQKISLFEGASVRLVLDDRDRRAIDDFCKAGSVTRFQFYLTVWSVLLHRFSRQRSVVVGLPVAARPGTEFERTFGYFVNTLVLRADVEESTTFESLLTAVRSDMLDILENQFCPFEKIVSALGLERDTSHHPLFQNMFVYQEGLDEFSVGSDLTARVISLDSPGAKFDLTLFVDHTADPTHGERIARTNSDPSTALTLEFSSGLFEEATARRLVDVYVQLLRGVIENRDTPLVRLPLSPNAESASILVGPARSFSGGPPYTFLEHFGFQARSTPRNRAVSYRDQSLTFEELAERSDRAARALIDRGIEPGDVISVAVPRGLDLVVGVLAILKSRAAFVPLDIGHPKERLSHMIADSGSKFVLTNDEWRSAMPGGVDAVCVADLVRDGRGEAALERPGAQERAYVIYTSGSTGLPKGVEINHGSFFHYISWAADRYEVAAGDGAIVHSTLAFDATLTSVFTPLLTGTCVTMVGEDSPVEELARLLENGKTYSLIKITPAHLRALAPIVDQTKIRDSVRYVVIGGEALRSDVVRFWYDRMPDTVFVNEYGPTETVVGCCVSFLQKSSDEKIRLNRATVPIGLPIADTSLYVLDEGLNVVPRGFPGELYIGGRGVGTGYVGNPRITRQRFLSDPFSADPSARMYRSGDLVRVLVDGELDYLGRIDSQVKLNGYRIELEEIEIVLAAVKGVRAAAVILDRRDVERPRLVAFVEATPDFRDRDALEELRSKLPPFMIPSATVIIEEMPTTVNGKVDRERLSSYEYPRGEDSRRAPAVGPRTDLERLLHDVWCDLLRIPSVSVYDSFFDLGGDSILSLQVVSRMRSNGYAISVREIFECRTIAETALRCEKAIARESRDSSEYPPVLLPSQHWLFSHAEPYDHYNQSVLVELRSELPVAQVREAFLRLQSRHDVFSHRFHRRDGVYSLIRDKAEIAFDESFIDGNDPRADAVTAAESLQDRLSIESGPLARAMLIRHAAQRNFLAIVVHHLIVDIVSWQTIVGELDTHLKDVQEGRTVDGLVPDMSTVRWAAGLSELAARGVFDPEISYWDRQSAAVKGTVTNFCEAGTLSRLGEASSYAVTLSPSVTHTFLTNGNLAFGTGPDEILLSALAIELSGRTGRESVGLCLESHGREEGILDVDVSSAIGWFTAIFPHEFVVRDPRDLASVLIDCKEGLRSIPHGGLGYGPLRSNGKLAEAGSSVFTPIVFNYLGDIDATISTSANFLPWIGALSNDADPKMVAPFALEITALVQNGQLAINMRYFPHRCAHEKVRNLLDATAARLEEILRFCVGAPRRLTPSDLPHAEVSRVELEELCSSSNPPEQVYRPTAIKQGMLFHSLFAPESNEYIEQLQIHIRGDVDSSRLVSSLERAASDYSALRTTFVLRDGLEPLELVRRNVEVSVRFREAIDADLHEIASVERSEKFSFQGEPLQRFVLVRYGVDRYLLLWTYHHAILDGWSAALVLQRFAAYYDNPITTFSPENPYTRYLSFLRRSRSHEAYWREYLAGFCAANTLRIEQIVAQPRCYESAKITIAGETADAVREVARRCSVTLSTILSATWALVLSRYSGETDVVFGETVSGRPPEVLGIEEMVGLFINTVPVRCKVKQEQLLRQFLIEFQSQSLDRLAASATPLSTIQQVSDIPRGELIFTSVLVFENYPIADALNRPFAGLSVDRVETIETTNFPITITVSPGAQIELHLRYQAPLYRSRDMEALLAHWNSLLEALPGKLDTSLQHIPLLSTTDQDRQRFGWNFRRGDYPVDKPINAFFEEQVLRTPDAIAVVDAKGTFTYDQLECRANQIARYLRSVDVRSGDLVGISVRPSFDMMSVVLGILKVGAAYVPIDSSYPIDRIHRMSTSTDLRCVVTEEEFESRFVGVRALAIDRLFSVLSKLDVEPLETSPRGDSLCYVIFTSGTTGHPKGAAVYHRGFVNLVLSHVDLLGIHEESVTQIVSSPSFDLTQKNLFLPLVRGGTVCFSEQHRFDPKAIVASLARNRVTWINCTPSAFYPLIDAARELGFDTMKLLEWVILGGEPMSIQRMIEWLENEHNRARIINSYGPTECADVSSSFVLENPREYINREVPIGVQGPNIELFVLDQNLHFLPVGVPGELYVGGRGVGAGYIGSPDLTAQKFISSDLPREGTKLYRTGDLVRADERGCIEFIGRMDHQVKIRGFRIELNEIQASIALHELVREALVVVRRDGAEDDRLVAYITLKSLANSGDAVLVGEIFSLLRERLPDYMIPAAIVVIPEFPLTPNGKLNRAALPAPSYKRSHSEEKAPCDSVEVTIRAIWSSVLQLDDIGVDDDFFECGGHSLLAIRVMASVEAAFGNSLPISALFQNPTIRGLASIVRTQQPPVVAATLVRFQGGDSQRPLFLVGGAGGMVTYLAPLARRLSPTRTVWGLEPRGLDGKEDPFSSIEETALAYVTALESVSPSGAIDLCGHSVGGKIVFEMARRLKERGRTVGALVLLDCCAPVPLRETGRETYSQADWILEVVSVIEEFSGEQLALKKTELERLGGDEQFDRVATELERIGFLPRGVGISRFKGFVAVYREQVFATYQPDDDHSGDLLVVKSEEPDPLDSLPNPYRDLQNDESLGWRDFLGGSLAVETVPGNHRTMMMEPNVGSIADKIETFLRKSSAQSHRV